MNDSIHAWSVGSAGPAEMLSDRAHGHELPRRAGRHLRSVVRDREQHWPRLVVVVAVDPAVVVAGMELLEQSFGREGVSEGDVDLSGVGLLDRDDLGEPLPRGQVLDDQPPYGSA